MISKENTEIEAENQDLKQKIALNEKKIQELTKDNSDLKILSEKLENTLREKEDQISISNAQFEGKIGYLEEELKESEKKCFEKVENIRVLRNQLEKMREEYNQLNEDFNTSMQFLNDHIANREKCIKEEDERLKKLNSIITMQSEDIQEKTVTINKLKAKIEELKLSSHQSQDLEISQKTLEDLDKKYKSLEKLYLDQIESNNVLQEKLVRLENSQTESSNLKIAELSEKIKEYEKKLYNDEPKEKNKKPHINLNENILEISDDLCANDYELTKSLEFTTSLYAEEDKIIALQEEENYSKISKKIITEKLLENYSQKDYELIKSAIDILSDIKKLIIETNLCTDSRLNYYEGLEKIVQEYKANRKNPFALLEGPISASEEISRGNFTEPSPCNSRKELSSRFPFDDIKTSEKLNSKKRQITLLKEEISLLKKKIRDDEKTKIVKGNLNLDFLKNILKSIFENIPKLDDKHEGEIEVCGNILGYSSNEKQEIKNARSKKHKFRLF